MDNHSEQITQYAKLEYIVFETIIYLQKEVVKEQDKLKQLKKEEHRNGKVNMSVKYFTWFMKSRKKVDTVSRY